MPSSLTDWPEEAFCDHGLRDRVDLFIDESGPREDRTLTLGILAVESSLVRETQDVLDRLATALETDHPALRSASYGGEWKGRLLARQTASRKERRAVGRGELLGDLGRQAVYARCLDAINRTSGVRAFALTYRWTGPLRGPHNQDGYRIRRAIQHALGALSFQVVNVRRAYIDASHQTHYTAGIYEYATDTGSGPVPHEFVDSATDRRIQLADLIAFAAHTSRFPGGSRVFPTAHGWLKGFAGAHVITLGDEVDHHITEP